MQTLERSVICPDCFGGNVFCEACGGSGVAYCCDGGNVDLAPVVWGAPMFAIKPEWAATATKYPIVFAEDREPRTEE